MIKNEQQYKIAKSNAANFKKTLDDLESQGSIKNVHPMLLDAEKEALKLQYSELTNQIDYYDALKSGKLQVIEVGSFDELPEGLIQARIAKGLSQKDLAEKLGLKEQQIQRYEATNYSTASFERIKEVIGALGIKINKEIFITDTSFSKAALLRNLKSIGLDSSIIFNRILPFNLAEKLQNIEEFVENEANNFVLEAASIIARVLNVEPKSLFKLDGLKLSVSAVELARFKKSVSSQRGKISAYTIYAHTLALLTLEATKDIKAKSIPSPKDIRKKVLKKYQVFNLKSLLNFIWDLGIPVLPLKDPGSFHGACWRVDGRNVIVLKQKTMSEAKFIYDACHEVGHATQHPEDSSFTVIETDTEAGDKIEEQDEREANYFAGELVLGESADDLAVEAILMAKQDLVKLKNCVKKIADREQIDQGLLANYIAFRLQAEQKINWWGTANNLQNVVSNPFEIAREILLERINFNCLNEYDQGLIARALN
ncbi:MAG TPA: helix-turn-helix domain-containing protein [Cyclobacteriaceae bacterium]|jgi:transcriptional regulator with XRE-family HTH domain/Zn-dependent peptidase ImmA (M78 family)|nr:helix-turn-helix domain-containing protein [Cyclobacteriaceae bacterium]